MSRSIATEVDLEAAVQEAERTAADLDTLEGAEAALFARVLRTTAQTMRLAIVAQADPRILLRLLLRLETTMRRASAISFEVAAPASQRATLPPPPGLTAHEIWSSLPPADPEAVTSRSPVPTASEVRCKVVSPKKKANGDD